MITIGLGPMEHRHINTKDDESNASAVHSIWERGLEEDICVRIGEVKKNAKAADAVARIIQVSGLDGKVHRYFRLGVHLPPETD